MTEEDIRNLKVGDKFIVEYTVAEVVGDEVSIMDSSRMRFPTIKNTGGTLGVATLVKPAPMFEVGDTVRIVPDPLTGKAHNGVAYLTEQLGKTFVIDDVDDMVGRVAMRGSSLVVDIHCLELVKKAAKDKYCINIRNSEYGNIAAMIWDRENKKEVLCYWRTYPNAEAAAKAECDRLNAEWRKQQEGNL